MPAGNRRIDSEPGRRWQVSVTEEVTRKGAVDPEMTRMGACIENGKAVTPEGLSATTRTARP